MQHDIPSDAEAIPYDRDSQRALTRQWDAVVEGRVSMAATRSVVRDSWQRSLHAAVRADLPKAPLVLSDSSLRSAQERADWVPFALRAAERLSDAFTNGHILSLFDAQGRMLSCDGDPAVLDGLAAINFRPGGLWTEEAVGTNGPGTALATGRAVHIVGAEHFCEAWHGWHCAAVPVADVSSNDLLGVIDISGFSRNAHPHTLQLAMALASSVREMLTAREMERRCAVLLRFAQLSARYAQDPLVAVDRQGLVLHATDSAPGGLRPGTEMPRVLRHAIAEHVRAFEAHSHGSSTTEVFLSLGQDIGLAALSFPVFDRGQIAGACLLLRGGATLADLAPMVSATNPSLHLPTARVGRSAVASTPVATPRVAVRETRYSLRDIVGTSPRMTEAVRLASAAAGNALPVFIVGESGTGKEVFAQTIHEAGPRRSRPFIAVNCAALPRELIEAELFGYVGGAFTGARREGSPGKFRAAEGGTIFLDEISEMPYGAQAALLRVLQEQEVSAVGSSEVRAINVRVIAATNRDVVEAVRSGQLRADLYYRLNVLSIELPPLRERAEDIPALAQHLLAQAATEVGRPALYFADGIPEQLARYPWPGNVRELKNLVRRVASLAPTDRIGLESLPASLTGHVAPMARAVESDDERSKTVDAMTSARTMQEAAMRLGINRSTLYRRLERFGLKAERLLRAQ
jgi:sigma-54 dependent transcriptional regulator, acetoin dehydrogenase operon transcriptional activator AcoR